MNITKIPKEQNNPSYFKLNNQLNIPVNGKIPMHKDKEAARAYFLEHVNPNTVFFSYIKRKIGLLTRK